MKAENKKIIFSAQTLKVIGFVPAKKIKSFFDKKLAKLKKTKLKKDLQ